MGSLIKNISKNILSFELIKWIAVLFLIVLSVVGSYVLCDYSVYIRGIVYLFFIIMAMYIAISTRAGKLLVLFGTESYVELKKVIWPTYKESLNITCIVVIVTVIISLILWGFDTILIYVISLGLRL